MFIHHAARKRTSRGSALLEALVAFLVLSVGMLTVARLQSHLRLHADISRQRAEAVRLAQEDIETLRGFAVLATSATLPAYDDIASATRHVTATTGFASQTDYRVSRRIEPAASLRAKTAIVTVSWTDLAGSDEQVVLQTLVAGVDPSFSGALALARSRDLVTGPGGRSIQIPLVAKDLGDGRSAVKPVNGGNAAIVFDNVSGHVIGRCHGVSPGLTSAGLTTASLGPCDAASGLLLSGSVRFTSASPPDPAQANELPPPLSIALTLTGGAYATAPWCMTEAMKTVSFIDTGLRIVDVPLAATPASLGLTSWSDTGDRHVQYHCVVTPNALGAWSGRSALVPSGWTIGTAPTDRRVCRYSSDLDASGAVDADIEHPGSYLRVDKTLANQNFLVIKGSENCPAGHAVQIDGQPSDVFADLTTAPHQP